MSKYFLLNLFERYADDIIVHCNTRDEAKHLLASIREMLAGFELELHPEKTKRVYCKNYKRNEDHEHNSFTFLSYSFQPRPMRNHACKNKFTILSASICCAAKTFIRQRLKTVLNPRNTQVSLEQTAVKLNPKVRGWLNYYCKFNPREAMDVFLYTNELIRRWFEEKYRLKSENALQKLYDSFVLANANLFVHWQKGIKRLLNNKSRMRGDSDVRICERLKLKYFGLLDQSINSLPSANTRTLCVTL